MKNKVELIGWYGGDVAIACSAWSSTSRELTDEKRGRIGKMLNDLWKAEPVPHGSPFEKGIVHFLVDTDIASHIHLLKHRISSLNAESARYKELKEDKYYLPEDWKNIPNSETVSAFCGYDYEWIKPKESNWASILEKYVEIGNELYHQSLRELTPILGRKRAKESARFFKTYNSQIQADVMFNMRSFNNFLTQRLDSHAQVEIREIAQNMLIEVANIDGHPFQHTLKAWGYG
jgi:flavin-dependent thymidylate synthase